MEIRPKQTTRISRWVRLSDRVVRNLVAHAERQWLESDDERDDRSDDLMDLMAEVADRWAGHLSTRVARYSNDPVLDEASAMEILDRLFPGHTDVSDEDPAGVDSIEKRPCVLLEFGPDHYVTGIQVRLDITVYA
jgi:hypothetical protein